ncbi:MAG: C40 family peptidase [Lachnospirales bacterium]
MSKGQKKRLRKKANKLEKTENKLFKAQDKVPEKKKADKKAKRQVTKKRSRNQDNNSYNQASDKQSSKLQHKEYKSKLSFESDRPKNSENLKGKSKNSENLKGRANKLEDLNKPTSMPVDLVKSQPKKQLVYRFHKEMEKSEDENLGVKTVHSTEKTAEFTGGKISMIRKHQKQKPYKRLAKTEKKATTAKINYEYEKKLAENPQLKSNPLSKFNQKRAIKKEYAKTYRSTYKNVGTTVKNTAKKGADFTTKTITAVTKNPKVMVVLLILMFVVLVVTSVSSTVSTVMDGVINSVVSSSYTSEDEELIKVEENYIELENDLQEKVNNIESDYPGYDEYRYNLAEIGHNPHALAAYLTALLQYYKADEVNDELESLFGLQYKLTIEEEVEIRYRTETRTDTWTDSEGNSHSDTYTVEVPYEYYILNVTLTNTSIDMLAPTLLTEDQLELYRILRQTKGNKPDLFPDNMESNVPPVDYQIPGDALTDPEFAALIQEAEKYLGFPYVWGGSSPSTSFDCSGFVCWVLNQTGTANIGRTTAQGIFNQCAVVSPSEAKPGDIIFFQGTYSTTETVTHVGIYVGDGMMIHCGDPIGYASINSSFWSSHFYAFGRLHTEQ